MRQPALQPRQFRDVLDRQPHLKSRDAVVRIGVAGDALDAQVFLGDQVRDVTQQSAPVKRLDQHARGQPHVVALGPFDLQLALRLLAQHVGQPGAVRAMDGHAATERQVAADRLWTHRGAAARQRDRQVADAIDLDR
jgi:hypothetical protein